MINGLDCIETYDIVFKIHHVKGALSRTLKYDKNVLEIYLKYTFQGYYASKITRK